VSDAIVDVHNVSRTFVVRRRSGTLRRRRTQVEAVSGVSFQIEPGEIVGYIGPNGAGKSTTIKMLTGILVPTGGHLRVAGVNPSTDRLRLARQIGVVFGQRTSLWWDLPLRESFALLRRIYHVAPDRYRRNLAGFTELLDLADLLDVLVRQLSLGQRMRGDIVAALLHDPKILYLDEPTIGLDIISKTRLREFLQRINAVHGVTVLLTTHDLVDIEQLCKRVMVIDSGRLVYDGSLAALHAVGGAARTLVVDLAEPSEPLRVQGAEVTRVDGPRQWLRFPADASAAPIVADIAARYDLADLSVHEPAIEEVITRLYERGGS
jgi:ABC-2 type transport system ATP-binding protein